MTTKIVVRRDTKRRAIRFNVAMIALELIGLIISFSSTGKLSLQYYTEQSNLLALIASVVFLIYLVRGKGIPVFVKWLKYTAAVGLFVTFVVTAFVLAPMFSFNYGYLFFYGALMYYHLICPLLGVYMFTRVDELGEITKSDRNVSLIWTVGYAAVMIPMNIIGVIDGPYPFLRVMSQPIWQTTLWIIVIFGATFGISSFLRRVRNSRLA